MVVRNEKLGKFLREAREAAELSVAQAAKLFGVTRQTVEAWEKGLNGPKRDRAVLVGKIYKVDPARIDPFAKAIKFIDSVNSESHTIPLVRLETISIKKPSDAREVDKALRGGAKRMLAVAEKQKDCIAVSISDTAMIPTFIPGDICIIDRTLRPEKGEAVVAAFAGKPLLLRVYEPRGVDSSGRAAFDLTSPNPDFETLTANSSNPAEIIGVVVELRREVLSRPR